MYRPCVGLTACVLSGVKSLKFGISSSPFTAPISGRGVRTGLENLYGTTEQQTNTAQNFPGRAARADYTTNCTCPQFVPLSIVPGFARRLQVPTNAIALVAELPDNRRLCAWVQIKVITDERDASSRAGCIRRKYTRESSRL